MSRNPRKLYSREFKVEAVKLITEVGYKATEAAQRLGICPSALCKNGSTNLKPKERQKLLFQVKAILSLRMLR